jgi:Ras-related protein Rab-5C
MKIVLLGVSDVGKTSIIDRLLRGTADENVHSTIGACFQTYLIETEKGAVSAQIWDTAGQERYRAILPLYYRAADVGVLVYDVTSMASFEGLESLANDVAHTASPDMRIVIVGNKVELAEQRVISRDASEAYAAKKKAALYCEVSARTGEGIVELFQKIGSLGPIPNRRGGAADQVLRWPINSKPDSRNNNRACC